MIAKPGIKFVLLGLGTAAVGLLLPAVFRRLLFPAGILFSAFCAFFFRDPSRKCPAAGDKIYSPADGTVLSILREGPAPVTTIRIFLSLWNVHVQRTPCAGKTAKIHYQPGAFHPAMRPEARLNERNSVTFSTSRGPVIVEQIAGFVARRIECRLSEGQEVAAGERLGMIYFGSQAALHLPENAEILVREGQKVKGGLTEMARWSRP